MDGENGEREFDIRKVVAWASREDNMLTMWFYCSWFWLKTKTKVAKKKVCLPYSAHAIGFRFFLPLLTFSFFYHELPFINLI
jgi:hypothetical protein